MCLRVYGVARSIDTPKRLTSSASAVSCSLRRGTGPMPAWFAAFSARFDTRPKLVAASSFAVESQTTVHLELDNLSLGWVIPNG